MNLSSRLGRSTLSLAFLIPLHGAHGQSADSSARVTWGGFIDTYYAWDFGRPPTRDRAFAGGAPFTTQPARHNEFNVNLAFIEARLDGPSVRGRLALQAGTSVQANYAGEPSTGSVSGPALSRHLQEAFAGIRVRPALWIDAGIFFSHVGSEGWISRDNLTYTRSLIADYSPYYQSGIRATWTPRLWLTAQLNVVNGWQNISEDNDGKGLGIRLDWTPVERVVVSGYNLLSEEAGDRLRALHGIGARARTGSFEWLLGADLGSQARSNSVGRTAHWYGLTAIGRARVTSRTALNARFEHFDDDEQIVIATGTTAGSPNPPFRGFGASLGVDVGLSPALWRTELRGFRNSLAVFPDGAAAPLRTNALVVSSLAMTF